LFGSSEAAVKAFGADVVAHYARAAEVELEAFAKSVTDWERFRGFERL
jgi:glutamine synthetase